MKPRKSYSYIILLFLLCNVVLSQSIKEEKMENLSFMLGDWVGTSTVYKNGVISKQVPAFQQISYDVAKNIIVVELHSELLQLHTIIYYDEKDEQYYYYPFSKNGVTRSPASFKDGKFIEQRNDTTRFVFSKTAANAFQEYGERLIDGKWVRFFEDNFKNTQ